MLGRLIPSLKVPSNLKAEDLTSDPAKQKEHDEDEHCQPSATIGWASEGLKAQDRVKTMAANGEPFPLPLLYMYSANDKVANPKVVSRVGQQLQTKDKTVISRDEEHEILNETQRQETYDIMSAWILNHL